MSEGYKERARSELVELEARIIKLSNFINSPEFLQISDEDQNDLPTQLSYMRLYYSILSRRVDRMGRGS